ncbi:desulfoferrodoxin [Candidatus Beckwithbacteria bacterium]|nr:desulfoferrodoxin [Candidatus Beckwithbacteria bacterium]
MTQKLEVYRCNVCGNIVEVLHASGGTLVCCGEKMQLLKENTVDAALEKHVPVIEKTKDGILVKIGAVPHPMEESHYIEWIELQVDSKVCKKFLNPEDKPEALFTVSGERITAREYCNLHELWKK